LVLSINLTNVADVDATLTTGSGLEELTAEVSIPVLITTWFGWGRGLYDIR
jgi:hypothetical protein